MVEQIKTVLKRVMPSGRPEVASVGREQNPRLNQVLLAALRQWRFFPAIQWSARRKPSGHSRPTGSRSRSTNSLYGPIDASVTRTPRGWEVEFRAVEHDWRGAARLAAADDRPDREVGLRTGYCSGWRPG